MLALATIPVTCWLCTLIATPRRPRLGDEVAELVYSRLLGRQQLLRLFAIVVPETEPTWQAWRDQWHAALAGKAIRAVRRRAKFLILDLDDGLALVVHLRMTGALTVNTASAPRHRHHRIAWTLEDGGELRF